MNKPEFIAAVAEKSGEGKPLCESIVNTMLSVIEKELISGGSVQFVGFGTFEVRQRAARTGINPKTKEPIKIAATIVPAFKVGKNLKESVQG